MNKRRREEGRTSNATTSGTGNPRLPLEQRSRRELYNLAARLGVGGRSRMRKRELARAIRTNH